MRYPFSPGYLFTIISWKHNSQPEVSVESIVENISRLCILKGKPEWQISRFWKTGTQFWYRASLQIHAALVRLVQSSSSAAKKANLDYVAAALKITAGSPTVISWWWCEYISRKRFGDTSGSHASIEITIRRDFDQSPYPDCILWLLNCEDVGSGNNVDVLNSILERESFYMTQKTLLFSNNKNSFVINDLHQILREKKRVIHHHRPRYLLLRHYS
jgi:hypothetical protein